MKHLSQCPAGRKRVSRKRVLSWVAVNNGRFLVHELEDQGPGLVPQIRVGLTDTAGGKLRALDPESCISFDAPRLPAYGAAVAKLLSDLRAAADQVGGGGLPFAERMTGSAFAEARRVGR